MPNNSEVVLTPDGLRQLAVPGEPREATPELPAYQVHRLSARLGADQVDEIVRRYEAGESARSLAGEHEIAPSALGRLLRERNVVVRKLVATQETATAMARDCEKGMTMVELEKKHGLSHGAVLRSLHSTGVEMRANAPRAHQK